MAEEWVGCAVGSGPTCNAGRCTLWIFGGKGYGILILIVSHLDGMKCSTRPTLCLPTDLSLPSIDTIVVFDVCTFVEIFKIWSKSIFFFFLSEKLFESFARRTKLHAENSTLPGEFDAVLTTDWQILRLRLDAAKSSRQAPPASNTLITPAGSGIFARQICADPR